MVHQKLRYQYIDLLRGWAVLIMIEVHVFNAFLIPGLRETAWFKVLNFINGLVAPSFLFIAGYSFVLIAQRKWDDYLSLNSVFWKQLGRILQILAVGYALHLPFFSFKKLLIINWDEWSVFWKIDVLHAIAISLFTLLLFVLIARKQKIYFRLIVALSLVVIFSSPYLYDTNLDRFIPEPVGNYFSAAHRSQFPLLPWMGFVLCGGITSQLLVWWKEKNSESKIFKRFIGFGFALVVISVVIDFLPIQLYPEHNYWRSNPAFFFIRLGIVLIVLSTLWFWEQLGSSKSSLVSITGAESLVAYSGHLLVIYGMFFNNHSLAFLIGKTQTIPEVIGMTAILLVATISVSYIWNRIKSWSLFYARVVQYSILVVVLYVFFTKPY
jgi:uncharacterized membrane protein